MRIGALFVLSSLLVLASGCDALRGIHDDHTSGSHAGPPPPRVRLVEARLAQHPTDRQLAAYFCGHVPEGSRLGPAGLAACRALGAVPSDEELAFTYEVELEVTNASSVRMPLVQALVGLVPFPDAPVEGDAPSGGALCLVLCSDGETCPQSEEGVACRTEEASITDLDSLGLSATGLTSVALAAERFDDIRMQSISPHGNVHVTLEIAVDRELLLSRISEASASSVAEARRGETPSFVIPYALDGSVWIDDQGHRIGASFPRETGEWRLE
jgi:hypothetical protein